MALADNASTVAAKFASLTVARQVGLLIGLAASIAIGIGVALWSRDPNYVPLFTQMSPRDASEIVTALERSGIEYKIDQTHGMVMVTTAQLQSARFKLAAQGLPRDTSNGEDIFSGSGAFNTSQFVENARYKQALEAELARTISKFNDIKAARVHLAIPRETAFVRDAQPPSASVFIDVYAGADVKKHTIAAIINLVASSIPNLNASRVTVVDQDGQLLSEGGGQTPFTDTDRYMDYRENLELQYAQKIQDMLTPMLGYGRVRAKVSADIDFTTFEQTQEMFNPELPSLRSEQTMQEKRNASSDGSGGVPGALSNSPQGNGVLAPKGSPQANGGQATNDQSQSNDIRTQSTKNFELDKTVSHTKKQPGTIKRLSVAVLVDNRAVLDEKTKKTTQTPLTAKEIEQIKLLVTDAIGLDTKRGDSLNVINSGFAKPEPIAAVPPESFWQKDWFASLVKQVLGALFILAVVFGVLRPMLKTLANNKDIVSGQSPGHGHGEVGYDGTISVKDATDFDSQLRLLRQVVDQEPKRVAQVVKSWVDRG